MNELKVGDKVTWKGQVWTIKYTEPRFKLAWFTREWGDGTGFDFGSARWSELTKQGVQGE